MQLDNRETKARGHRLLRNYSEYFHLIFKGYCPFFLRSLSSSQSYSEWLVFRGYSATELPPGLLLIASLKYVCSLHSFGTTVSCHGPSNKRTPQIAASLLILKSNSTEINKMFLEYSSGKCLL